MPSVPVTMALDEETKRNLAFIMRHCPSPRSMSAVVRGMAAKYRRLLEKQLEGEKNGIEGKGLWLTGVQPATGEELDLRF